MHVQAPWLNYNASKSSGVRYSEDETRFGNIFSIVFSKTKHDIFSSILAAEILIIGLASFLFHTFANSLTAFFDVFSIICFALTYILFTNFRLLHLNLLTSFYTAGCLLILSQLGVLIFRYFFGTLNGSIWYCSFIFLYFFYSMISNKKNPYFSKGLLNCALLLSISIFFRSIDIVTCELSLIGTHFLWHFFNSILLGISVWIFFISFANGRKGSSKD